MYCLIRVNANPQLGNGHLMRCLTLARIARGRGFKVLLALSDEPGVPVNFVQAAGFNYVLLPVANEIQDAQLFGQLIHDLDAPCRVVVDVYALAAPWHQFIYPLCEQLLVIDDLANRTYYCDQLLDHTPGRIAADYAAKVNAFAKLSLGCEQALLAPEFFAAVNDAKAVRADFCRHQRQPKLLVSLGGTDPHQLSHIWFNLLAPHAQGFARISFLLASNAVGLTSLAKKIAIHQQTVASMELIVDAAKVPQLMLAHDLAIGGAGVSALERAALGVPSLLLTLADNQIQQAQALINAGCALNLGDWQQLPSSSAQQVALDAVLAFKNDYARYTEFSRQAFNLIAVERPYQAINDFLTHQRAE